MPNLAISGGMILQSGTTLISPDAAPTPSASLNMPLTWATAIAGTQPVNYASSIWRQNVAKFNVVEYQNWPGIEGSMGGQTIASSMADVKARAASLGNPLCLTGCYQIPQELYDGSPLTDPRSGLFSACNTNHWWCYTGPGAFPGGTPVIDAGFGAYVTNQCANTNLSALGPLGTSGWTAGLDFCYGSSVFEFNYIINGTPQNVGQALGSCAANPYCDFLLHDNQFENTRNSGQWLYTSTVYPQGEFGSDTIVQPFFQAGYARQLAKWRALYPTVPITGKAMMFGGNCDWGAFASPVFTPPVIGLYDIPFSEKVFGNSNPDMQYSSPNNYLGNRMVAQEQLKSRNPYAFNILNNEGGPCPGVTWPNPVTVAGWQATFTATATQSTNTGSAIQTGTFWQSARYIACFALLRGWAVEVGGTAAGDAAWLDEYQKGILALWNWLGAPIDPPLTSSNIAIGSQGAYKRRYTNGTVYVNPLGNGTQNIPITDTNHHALQTAGFGDPNINNGALYGSTFQMFDADGRILIL